MNAGVVLMALAASWWLCQIAAACGPGLNGHRLGMASRIHADSCIDYWRATGLSRGSPPGLRFFHPLPIGWFYALLRRWNGLVLSGGRQWAVYSLLRLKKCFMRHLESGERRPKGCAPDRCWLGRPAVTYRQTAECPMLCKFDWSRWHASPSLGTIWRTVRGTR